MKSLKMPIIKNEIVEEKSFLKKSLEKCWKILKKCKVKDLVEKKSEEVMEKSKKVLEKLNNQ